MSNPLIHKGDTVLFIGDSITDATRKVDDSNHLGYGYVFMAAGLFGLSHPEREIRFLNRGIAGNTVRDLEKRWAKDCLELKPNWITIMVGINDATRRYKDNEEISTESFITIYRNLLLQAYEQFQSKFIIMEPFVLPTSELRIRCREDLDPKINAIKKLAQELDALYVPLDEMFAQARIHAADEYWAPDGVHPTPAGHALMARAWLRVVGANI